MSGGPRSAAVAGATWDVAVLGAGVSGAVAALLAARQGLRVLLLERQYFPRGKICGCCLNQRAQAVLRLAGLEGVVSELSPVRTEVLRLQRGGRRLELPVPGGLVVSRRALDERLVAEAIAAGVEFVDDATAVVVPESESDLRRLDFRRVAVTRTSGGGAPGLRVGGFGDERTELRGSEIRARVILACDGLGHTSLSRHREFQSRPVPGARVGLGVECPRLSGDDHFGVHEIVMAIGGGGYVGVVRTECDRLNLAAAVDSGALQKSGSPVACLSEIFAESGVRQPQGLEASLIRGTPPLTRRSPRLAGHRLLLLGDATGYVEPFTGEGMAWALTAAWLAVPLACEGLTSGWTENLEQQYARLLDRAVGREQFICRGLASILRHPFLSAATMMAAGFCPWAVRSVVHRINRLPHLPEFQFETV
ncbi:MAG: NAD(P)/FAD-dependent oxidoreductase [Planctomycetota bacterium]